MENIFKTLDKIKEYGDDCVNWKLQHNSQTKLSTMIYNHPNKVNSIIISECTPTWYSYNVQISDNESDFGPTILISENISEKLQTEDNSYRYLINSVFQKIKKDQFSKEIKELNRNCGVFLTIK